MAEYVGSASVLRWVHSAGTANLSADVRSIQWSPTVDFVDATAGQDTTRVRLTTFKDATLSVGMVAQSGTASDYATILQEGASGTVLYSPAGTATGNRLITMPAYAMGLNFNSPYDDVVEVTVEFQANGAYTYGAH